MPIINRKPLFTTAGLRNAEGMDWESSEKERLEYEKCGKGRLNILKHDFVKECNACEEEFRAIRDKLQAVDQLR